MKYLDYAFINGSVITVNEKDEIALSVKGLSFAYGKKLFDVLFDLNYKAYKGKINVILGANASGKTTLLKCISKVLKPYSGRVKATGRTAYMPQEVSTLFLEETVWQEVPSEELLKKTALIPHSRQGNYSYSSKIFCSYCYSSSTSQ